MKGVNINEKLEVKEVKIKSLNGFLIPTTIGVAGWLLT